MKNAFFAIIQILSLFVTAFAIAQDNNLTNEKALNNFYNDIKSKQKPIHIIYIGDSHTAADFITQSLRKKLQDKWGDGGRGIIQFGNPYAGFKPQGLEIISPKSWVTKTSYPATRADSGPFALGGYRAQINNDEKYLLKTIEGKKFNNISLCALTKTNNDVLEININDKSEKLDFNKYIGQINCKKTRLNNAIEAIEIGKYQTEKSPEITSIGVWNDENGIILSSFGIPGAQLSDFDKRSFHAISAEMNIIIPSLVIFAFGTNEGFSQDFETEKYQELLKLQIDKVHKIAPMASILIIGAPDANRKTLNAGDIDDCKIIPPNFEQVYPNINYDKLGAKYYPPPNLEKVREAQKKVVNEMNIAFWDWEKAMGGPCSANQLSLLQDREIMGDRVHFSKIGAQKIGEKIANDLIVGFENFGAE